MKRKQFMAAMLAALITAQGICVTEPVQTYADTGIPVTASTFPDSSLCKAVQKFDKDQNGLLDSSEIESVTDIDISDASPSVNSLDGIGIFKNLKHLDCNGQTLVSMNLSGLPSLESVDASSNRLTEVVLPQDAANLKELDLSDNKLRVMPKLDKYTSLQSVALADNQISEIRTSEIPNVENLEVGGNPVKSLDLSNNQKLKTLSCKNMTMLSSLDVSTTSQTDHTSLAVVDCTGMSENNKGSITEINLSGDKGLQILEADNNSVSALNLNGVTGLKQMGVSGNKLKKLDVTPYTELKELRASDNQISSIDLTKNGRLETVELANTGLTGLDVTGCTGLKKLDLHENGIARLDLSANDGLTQLYLQDNVLESVDLKGKENLQKLNLSNNRLVAVDISDCQKVLDYINGEFKCTGNSRDVYLDTDDYTCDLSQLSKDGFVKENEGQIDRNDSNVKYDACVKAHERNPLTNEIENAVEGATINGYKLQPELNVADITYNYYYGVKSGTVKFNLHVVNPLTMKVWYTSNGNVTSTYSDINMKAGDKTTLTATEASADSPEKLRYNNITWSSSDKSIASINENGVLTCLKDGTANIYIHMNGKVIASCRVVSHKPVARAEFVDSTDQSVYKNGSVIKMETGSKVSADKRYKTISPKCYASDGSLVAQEYSGMTYTVTDSVTAGGKESDIVTCSSRGEITAVNAGTAYVHCVSKDSGVESVLRVDVVRRADSVKLSADNVTLFEGDSTVLTAEVKPSNAANKAVIWSSLDENIAVVDANGKITGKNAGKTDIYCRAADNPVIVYAIAHVTVNKTNAAKISLNYNSYDLEIGGSYGKRSVSLKAEVTAADPSVYTVSYKSSNTNVATVDEYGKVTAVAPGQAVIRCSISDSVYTECTITVTAKVTGLTITAPTTDVYTGRTLQLKAEAVPDNAQNKNVTWKSSNEKVATVSSTGIVTGVAKGVVTITATAADGSGKTADIFLFVKQSVTDIVLDHTSAKLNRGQTLKLTASVGPSSAYDKSIEWYSSNINVATVDVDGLVRFNSKGTADIICTAGDGSGTSAKCTVTVIEPVKSVSLDAAKKTVYLGKTCTLKPSINPSNASITDVTWSSSNPKVATVDANGVVKPVAKGTAVITCTSKDASKAKTTCEITVKQYVTSVKLNTSKASVYTGRTYTLKPFVGPSSASSKAVSWKSSNTKIATVTSKGVVKGIRPGTAIITCTAKDGSKKYAACKVTVRQSVTSVKLNAKKANVYTGRTYTLKPSAGPSSAYNKAVTWKSSNTKIATVTSKGVVKGIRPGTATITCTAKDGSKKYATCKVTVKQSVTGISLNKKSATLRRGRTLTLKAAAKPKNAANKAVTWKSSNTKIATVNSKGVVKAVGKGKATITCTAKDGSKKSAKCTITVR